MQYRFNFTDKFRILVIVLNLFFSFAILKAEVIFPPSFKLSFEQVIKSQITNKEKKNYGTLEYQTPGKIRMEIVRPDVITFVRNEQASWYYVAPFLEDEPGEVTITSGSDVGLSRLFDLLNEGLKNSKKIKVVKNKDHYQVKMEKKTGKETGVASANLYFKNLDKIKFEELFKLDIFYVDARQVTLNLSDHLILKDIPKDRFVFQIPANTKVTK